MPDVDVGSECLEDQIHEAAQEAKERWISYVALYSAIVAALTAVASLMAGDHANEAMISQIKASNQWNYFQAKGIKNSILQTRTQILTQLGRQPSSNEVEKAEEYKKEQEDISAKAKDYETSAERHLNLENILSKGVTFFQVAIAIAAISILTKRRPYWWLSMGFSTVGIVCFVLGILRS